VLGRIADLTWERPKRVLAVIGVLAVVAGVFGHDVEHHLLAAGFTDSASESEKATALLKDTLGYDANPGLMLVVRNPDGGRLDLRAPAVRSEVASLNIELQDARHIGRVEGPVPARDGESAVLLGHLDAQDVEAVGGESADDIKPVAKASSLDVAVGGFVASFAEVNDQTRKDLTNAELIAFPALGFLLLLVFRSVIAAAIPLAIGFLSILGTFLFLRLMSEAVDTSLFALNISTGLSLGLAVDYALLMVTRYREEAERDGHTREAHRRMVQSAGRAALFSGATVAVAMIALIALPQRFLYSLGVAGASVGLLSATTALLVVPSMLALLGKNIDKWSIRRARPLSDESGGWYRLAHAVLRRPVVTAVLSLALLLGLASPLTGTVLTGPSAEAVPDSQPAYDANAYVSAHYPRSVTEAVTVTVHGPVSDAQLAGFRRELAGIPDVTEVKPFGRASDTVAFANLALGDRALSERSQDVVRAVRGVAPPGTSDVLVSGNTARFIDQKESLADHAPLVLALVAAGTLLILFLLTGSVLLPLKTLLMNGFTLASVLGVLVLVFQEGFLSGLLGYSGPEAIEVTSLVFLSAVTFGLATDYAVLVVARIKEQHDAGVPNAEAVAHGIARTGRVISAAAAMIAVVFLAFAVSPVFFMKQIAIGMVFGVLIDATVVRALLVPALMRLLGDYNWWAPKPLRRLHGRIGISEA
jgi:RND superfamily putative drug exporter